MVLIDGLLSYYKLDEVSGTVLDAHGGSNGTNDGATTNVTGKIGTAYTFNGTTDQVSISPDTSLNTFGDGSISVSLWFKTTTGVANDYMFSKRNSTYPMKLGMRNGKTKVFLFDGTNNPTLEGTTTVNNNEWHHIVGVRDTAADKIRIYIDGSEDATEITDTTNADISNTANVTLASEKDATNYAGTLDEIGIWGKALTGAEITELYAGGSGLSYPFSEVTATLRLIKLAGTFVEKPILTKVSGTFVDKPIKIKVGGTFQDA